VRISLFRRTSGTYRVPETTSTTDDQEFFSSSLDRRTLIGPTTTTTASTTNNPSHPRLSRWRGGGGGGGEHRVVGMPPPQPMNRTPGARCNEVLLRRWRRQHQWRRPTGAGRQRRFSSSRPVVARAPCPPSESSCIIVCHLHVATDVYQIFTLLPVSKLFFLLSTLLLVCIARSRAMK